jgi:hypothetical protein
VQYTHIPVKRHKRYVDQSELSSKRTPVVEKLSSNECLQYERESNILDYLTKKKCNSTPEYVAHFQRNEDNLWVQGGFLCFILMELVPGRTVSHFWVYDPVTEEQRDEQRRIEQAFKKALL